MFKSFWRFIKAVMYYISGKFIWGAEKISDRPDVVRAKYQDVIDKKRTRIQQHKQAVAQVMTVQHQRKAKLQQAVEEEAKTEKLRLGAEGQAKKRIAALQAAGKPIEEIKADPDLLKHKNAHQSFHTREKELEARIAELEKEIEANVGVIDQHKRDLQELQREIMQLQQEQGEAVADIAMAKATQEANDALSGIANDGSAEDLRELREQREKAKAGAAISAELAGNEARHAERDYLREMEAQAADDDFFNAIGLVEEPPALAVTAPPAPAESDTEKKTPAEAVDAGSVRSDPLPE